MDLKPCRDCGTPVQWTARSCPHCGIMNPVHKWVALPDGADETYREPVFRHVETPAPAYAAPRPETPAPPARGRFNNVFGPVTTPEEAAEVIRQVASAFYVFAAIDVAVSFFLGPAMLVVAAVLAGLATWLRVGRSQVAAALLVLFTLFNLVMVVKTGAAAGVWLAVFATGISYRALKATMLLADAPA